MMTLLLSALTDRVFRWHPFPGENPHVLRPPQHHEVVARVHHRVRRVVRIELGESGKTHSVWLKRDNYNGGCYNSETL